jgi:nucleotide-binding universal stress UspA family protein
MTMAGHAAVGRSKVRNTILVGSDFSRPARRALQEALSLAQEGDAGVMVLHVIHAPDLEELAMLAGVTAPAIRERLMKERRERLAELVTDVQGDRGSDVPVETIIAWGHPYEVILKKASDAAASLIVMGTAGPSADMERALFGSTAEKVLRSAACPVLCVPGD